MHTLPPGQTRPLQQKPPRAVEDMLQPGVFYLSAFTGDMQYLALLRKVKGNAVLYIVSGLFGGDVPGEIAVGFFYDSVGHFI